MNFYCELIVNATLNTVRFRYKFKFVGKKIFSLSFPLERFVTIFDNTQTVKFKNLAKTFIAVFVCCIHGLKPAANETSSAKEG